MAMNRDVLQGIAFCLGGVGRRGHRAVVVEALADMGLTYHDLHGAGAEAYDLGEIAKARDEMRRLGWAPKTAAP